MTGWIVFNVVSGVIASLPACWLLRTLHRLRAAGHPNVWCEVLVTAWVVYGAGRTVWAIVWGPSPWWMVALAFVLLGASMFFLVRVLRGSGARDDCHLQASRPAVKSGEPELAGQSPKPPD